MKDLYALIPVFNELSSIENGQSTLERFCDEFSLLLQEGKFEGATFVDDGSTDGTGEYLRKYFSNQPLVTVITQTNKEGIPSNSGKTKAVLRGIEHLISQDSKYIFTFDGDMYNLSGGLVDYMADRFESNPALEMAIGSYYQGKELCPPAYSGLRVLRTEAIKRLITPGTPESEKYKNLIEYEKPEHGFCWELILNDMFQSEKMDNIHFLHKMFPINSRAPGSGSTSYEKIQQAILIGEEKLGISRDPLYQFS